jgi:hypothetical protein
MENLQAVEVGGKSWISENKWTIGAFGLGMAIVSAVTWRIAYRRATKQITDKYRLVEHESASAAAEALRTVNG